MPGIQAANNPFTRNPLNKDIRATCPRDSEAQSPTQKVTMKLTAGTARHPPRPGSEERLQGFVEIAALVV